MFGEHIGDETGGYHFYPDRDQVSRWLKGSDLVVVAEANEPLEGYGYHHLLLKAE